MNAKKNYKILGHSSCGKYIIHVKRLFDGQTFMLHEKDSSGARIREFIENSNLGTLTVELSRGDDIHKVDLNSLEKAEVLFKTHDGVNVYPGYTLHAVPPNLWPIEIDIDKGDCEQVPSFTFFFNRQAAEKYISDKKEGVK